MRTLIVGSSGGIGEALVKRCADDGDVVSLSRTDNGLELTDEPSIERATASLEGSFERIIIATGILAPNEGRPEKRLADVRQDALSELFAINAAGPILILKHLISRLPKEKASRIAVLSARVGSIGDNGIGGWYAYRASKAALNQLVRTAAIELSRTHRKAVLVALHPGTVATAFTADYQGRHKTVAPEVAAENLLRVLDGLEPSATGSFLDQNGDVVVW